MLLLALTMKGTRDFQRCDSSDNLYKVTVFTCCSKLDFHLQSFKEIVAACLVKDPKKRPTAEKLLKHRFFKHAHNKEFIARTILDGLSPLGDRFRMLKVGIFISDFYSIHKNSTVQYSLFVSVLMCLLFISKKRLSSSHKMRLCMVTKTIYHR